MWKFYIFEIDAKTERDTRRDGGVLLFDGYLKIEIEFLCIRFILQ